MDFQTIKRFCCEVDKRLGNQSGIDEIKQGSFFRRVDWQHIRSKNPAFEIFYNIDRTLRSLGSA